MTDLDSLTGVPAAGAAQLWGVLDEIPARVSLIDRARRHVYVNRAYAEFIGRPADEILGRTVAEIYGADEDARLRLQAEAALAGETLRWEGWIKGPGDVDHFIERVYKPHRDDRGEVVGVFVLVRDTTELRQAERERERMHRTLHDAIESLPNGFIVYGPDRKVILCNSAFADMMEASAEALIGLSPEEVLRQGASFVRSADGRPVERPEDWVATVMTRFEGRNPEPVGIELHDGRAMLISIHPTGDGGFVGIRTDVTALKQMQQALRDSEAVARNVLGACPLPVGMTRAEDGAILYESPASEALFVRDASRPREESAADYWANPADRQRYLDLLRKQGTVDGFEAEMAKSDGTRFWASISARRITYQGEEVIVSSTQDLTERRELEASMAHQREALYQSEKLNALGGLLAGVAHELNNPLSVVVGQAQLLRERAVDADTRIRAERINSAAERCARIVRTFLAMARQTPPERGEVALNGVVDSALEITAYALRSAGIEVVRRFAEDLPTVWANADQLNQVVMNLIVNAEQAISAQVADRRLTLETFYDPGSESVCLAVTDNGPGIPAELRSRIFDPFFTTKDVGMGTGVGLTVCHSVVEAHEGRLLVDSAPDRGTTFTVYLPVGRARAAAQPTAMEAPAAARGRVLIVDDEPEVSETLADMVALKGHEVEVATSGHAAMRALSHRDFDVILCDMRMPDVDGRGLYSRIRQAYPELVERIVFVTGDALGPSNRSFLDETGLPYLEKPLAADEVLQVVARVLGHGEEQLKDLTDLHGSRDRVEGGQP